MGSKLLKLHPSMAKCNQEHQATLAVEAASQVFMAALLLVNSLDFLLSVVVNTLLLFISSTPFFHLKPLSGAQDSC